MHQEYFQIHTPLRNNENSDNGITTTEEIVYTQSLFIKRRKRKYTSDKSKHVCNPERKKKRQLRKNVSSIIDELKDIL